MTDPIPGRRLRGEEHVGSTTDPREAQRGFDGEQQESPFRIKAEWLNSDGGHLANTDYLAYLDEGKRLQDWGRWEDRPRTNNVPWLPAHRPTPWTILRAVIREDRAFIGIMIAFPVWVASLVLLVVALR